MTNSNPTNRGMIEERLMPAARNLLGNKSNPEVQQLLAAGANATPDQKKRIAEKYLAPFFEGDAEHADILLDEILKVAEDQEQLEAVERALSGSPVNDSIDFDPQQFLEAAARQMTGDYEGMDRPDADQDLEGAIAPPLVVEEGGQIPVPTKRTADIQEKKEITEENTEVAPPPPMLPDKMILRELDDKGRPQDQGGEDYMQDQLDDAKAPDQPAPSTSEEKPEQTPREAQEQGLQNHQNREREQQYNDQVSKNTQETIAALGAGEQAAAEAQAAADAQNNQGGGLKPGKIAAITVGGALLFEGGLLATDFFVNTIFTT